jgi:hypothetical protein
MTYTGRVEKGVVVFDGPTKPNEGSVVRVEELEHSSGDLPSHDWRRFAGSIDSGDPHAADHKCIEKDLKRAIEK